MEDKHEITDEEGSESLVDQHDGREIFRRSTSFDASKIIERSQSDAALSVRELKQALREGNMAGDMFDHSKINLGKMVSESNKVYFDLSNIDNIESEEREHVTTASSGACAKDVRVTVKRGQLLETIPQDEELSITQRSKITYSSSKSYSEELTSRDGSDGSSDEDQILEYDTSCCNLYSKYPLNLSQTPTTESHLAWQSKNNVKLKYQTLCASLEKSISALKRATASEEVGPLNEILCVMKDAWDSSVYGRDLAYCLCDIVRNEGVLDLLIKNCRCEIRGTLVASVALLEQVLSTKNRLRVAECGLEAVVKLARKTIGDHELAASMTGILENLFKISEATSSQVVGYGGLDALLYWCRSSETMVLRRCAKALSNLSLFGGPENQELMTKRNVPEWLFPLAFMEDNHIRYYACLSIAVLATNKELEAAVIKSGTLDLVLPFVSSQVPKEFAQSDYSHKQGRDAIWLQRLKPLLCSRRQEAQALAAFHFAMEAAIKSEQGKSAIFYDIGVIEPLKKVASSPNAVASKLAGEALQTIGEEVPHKLSQQVPLWAPEDVSHWVTEVGFKDYAVRFQECLIDGDLLLQMQEEDLEDSINMVPGMTRKRFLRELVMLKVTADYSSYDPSHIDPWLMSVLPELSQYTYTMLRHGMDRQLLSTTTNEELRKECCVKNGIHRRIILQHLDGLVVDEQNPGRPGPYIRNPGGVLSRSSMDFGASLSVCPRPVDIFISYRRATGSQLASLLKVHLQLRGFSVFLDIDRLRAGKFDENLLLNIKLAKHFLLVLTTSALDRCIGDVDRQDWVHKEIVTALESNCNIIPILDNCDWPEPEQLPEDMRPVCYFNGIRWIHDYQDACIDKLQSFLKGSTPVIAAPPLRLNHLVPPLSPGVARHLSHHSSREHMDRVSVCSLASEKKEQNGSQFVFPDTAQKSACENQSAEKHADK